MTDDTDFVTEWARVTASLSEARRAALKALGYDEGGLRDLHDRALAIADDVVSTEFGVVQKIPDKPIQWRARRSAEDTEPLIHKTKLKLLHKREDV